jgi:translation initiation factor IF-1
VKPKKLFNSPRRKKPNNSFERKPDKVYFESIVVETLPGVKFKVKVERGETLEPLIISADLKSFLKVKRVKIIKGDKVWIEVDPIDLTKGVIVNRI